MRKILRTILLMIAVSWAFSCTIKKRVYMQGYYVDWMNFAKTDPNPEDTKFVSYSLNAYNALSTKHSQEAVINAFDPEDIYCDEGTIISFPEDAFVYENGKAIKCSQVAIYVTEFYAMSDILESGLTTTCNKRTLSSAGMVYIEASCHGERLKLKPGKKVAVSMPASNYDKKMKAFSGRLKGGIIDWKVNGGVSNILIDSFTEVPDSESLADRSFEGEGAIFKPGIDNQEGYLMTMSKLGWINCDRFYDMKTSTHLLVKADSVAKTCVAMIFKQMKSVLPGYQFANHTTEFKNVPLGEQVTVLAYRVNEKAKEVTVGRQEVVLGDTNVVQLNMEVMSIPNFKTLLAGYN
ncbi:MAG: hypothetical protein V4580_14760 [Bacteroidota bacterium]